MFQTKKILVILLIATFLVAIPLSLLNQEPEITVIVNKIEIDTDYARPPGAGVKPDKPEKTGGGKPGDYKLTGQKWDLYLPSEGLTLYVGEGLDASVITASAEEWDNYADKELVNTVTIGTDVDIFDEFDDPETLAYDPHPDGNNELVFADLDQGVIAVCYTWYYTDTNEIFQFDIAFNTDYTWGDAEVDSTLMDLQNIATHELGHGFGLADIYKPKLSYLTMFGYSGEGDTQKRDLAQGDIDGIQALYGVPT